MTQQTSIGFIGTGNMGAALVKGISTCPAAKDIALYAFDKNNEVLTKLGQECQQVRIFDSAVAIASQPDYLVLAAKPQYMQELCEDITAVLNKETVVVSIAAGIPSKTLVQWTGKRCPVVRVMPNTPVLAGRGIFAVNLEDKALAARQKDFLTTLFGYLGQVHILPETLFDAFTAIAGSGPAYVFAFMEAVIEAGVTLGLARKQTTEIVEELFTGSAILAQQSSAHISVLREMVCSPGGTAIQATNHFDAKALRATIVEAIAKCCARSKALGE